MQDLIKLDLFRYEFLSIISPIDFYHLKLTTKNNYQFITLQWIKESIITHIDNRLSKVFNEHFNEILNKTGAVITGSFILQCILGVYWESDIDICFPILDNQMFKNDISGHFVSELEQFLYETCQFKLGDSSSVLRYMPDKKGLIKHVRTYITDSYDIDVIQMNTSSKHIINKIIQSSDFDICKNVFYIKDNKPHIHIFKLLDIFQQKTTFKFTNRLDTSVKRCNKYKKRGFIFDNTYTADYLLSKIDRDVYSMGTMNNSLHYYVHQYDVLQMDEHQYKILKNVYNHIHCDIDIDDDDDDDEDNPQCCDLYIKDNILTTTQTCQENCILCFCQDTRKHLYIECNHCNYLYMIK